MSNKKQLRSRVTQFSSEDSQNTDYSMDSSLEIAESAAQKNMASKFNQLRESMNQLFLANPELAEEIKFDKYTFADEIMVPEVDQPKSAHPNSASPLKRGATNFLDTITTQPAQEETNTAAPSSAKFWGVISKEMSKPQKNSKLPTLNQINHILNIFKSKFDAKDSPESNMTPKKSPNHKRNGSKGDFRIQGGKGSGDKNSRNKEGRAAYIQGLLSPQSAGGQEVEEDGVNYFSFRKKMHLQFKQKRMQRDAIEQLRKKEIEAEQNRVAKENEEMILKSSFADLDDEIARKTGGTRTTNNRIDTIPPKYDIQAKANPKPRIPQSRRDSKHKTDIFERLTKDPNQKAAPAEEEEEDTHKRQFISPFTENLYKDMKAFGDPEAFKKIAQARISNYKKEFKEKMAKQKQVPADSLKFGKEKFRYLNMFMPDFEKTSQVVNKEAVFAVGDVMKDGDEWKENQEQEILARFQKILQGNILEFWQDTKDLNN